MSAPQTLVLNPGAGRRAGRRLNPSLVVGGLLVLLVVAMALVSFVWTPYDPTLVDPTSRLLTPSAQHWLGTDKFGRDVLSQIIVGARTTLFVGFVAVGVAAVIGLAGAVYGVGPTSILPVVAFVAAAVYLADVRPKVRSFPKNRSGSSSGPYGPW